MAGGGVSGVDEPSQKRRSAPPPKWSDLPPDPLRHIARNLTSIWDYIRFRGVCTSWRSSADTPPAVPSLLLPYQHDSTARSFLDPSDRSVHTINIPEAHNKWLYGTPHGWLVMIGQDEGDDGWIFTISLLNPITRDTIPFPPLPREVTRLREQAPSIPRSYCTKTVLTGNPASSPLVLLGLLLDFSKLAFCNIGGEAWTMVQMGVPSAPFRIMIDMVYLDGTFYVLDVTTGVTLLTVASLKKTYKSPNTTKGSYNGMHLVELCGDIFMLERYRGWETEIKVFKLDRKNKKLKWVKVGEGLGDRAFFVSYNHSSISIPSRDFQGGGGTDLICFAGDDKGGSNLCISDIVAGSSIWDESYYWKGAKNELEHGFEKGLTGLTWIIPSMLRIESPSRSGLLDIDRAPRPAVGDDSTTRREEEPARKWSDLPPDVLQFVSRYLTGIFDYVRFRGVCPLWRSAASPGDRPPQTPLLLIPYDLGITARSFFDPSDRRVHTINIPESLGKWIYGTPYGWLVMLGEKGGVFSVSLLNPITRAQICFPTLPSEITKLPEQEAIVRSTKPVLTANPASSRDHQEVLLALLIFSRLIFCRLGGDMWTVIELSIPRAPRLIMVDFTYFDGAFYVVDNSEGITVVSPSSLKKKHSAAESMRGLPDDYALHLVKSSEDLLLVLCKTGAIANFMLVFKLNRSTRKLKWEMFKESIGDKALFLSHNHSSVSMSSHEFLGSRHDLICYAGVDSKHEDRFGDVNIPNICISDIVNGGSILRGPYYWRGPRRRDTYGKIRLGLTWIIPSLC